MDRLWGLPVVTSKSVPQGTVVFGEFGVIASECSECLVQQSERCLHCWKCQIHHGGIPFAACQRSEFAQRVIKSRGET